MVMKLPPHATDLDEPPRRTNSKLTIAVAVGGKAFDVKVIYFRF
jgi:hypothetical protein